MSDEPTKELRGDMAEESETRPIETPAAGTGQERPEPMSATGPGPAAGPGATGTTVGTTVGTTAAVAPERRGPSVPTVVWGLLFALIAAAVLTAQVSDVNLDLNVTAPTALLIAGVVLVLWGIAGLGRSRHR